MLPGKRYTPDELLRIAVRYKWLVIFPLLVALGIAVLVARALPNRYTSETVIQVIPQRIPENYVRSTVTERIEERLQSIGQTILSRKRLESLIVDFNLYPSDRASRPMEDVVERMRVDIQVRVIKGDAFKLSYTSANPQFAMKVAERLASMFVEENIRDREVLADGTNAFLEMQLQDARKRLMEKEQALESYKQRYAGQLPTQTQANLQVLQNTQAQLTSLTESINRDRDRRLQLEKQIDDESHADPFTPTAAPAANDAGSTQQQLDKARAMLSELMLRLKPEHPDVIRARRLVTDLEKQAEAEALKRPLGAGAPAGPAQSPRDAKLAQLKAQLDALDKQIAAKESDERRFQSAIAQYQARLEAAPKRESEMVELMRDYGTLQNLYASLLAKREDSKMAADLERRQVGEQFRVLDPARVPEVPVSPNRPLIIIIGAAIGLALGVGLAAALEFRDASLRTETEVMTVLAIPVLANIPVLSSEDERRRVRRNRRLVLGSAFLMTALCVAGVAMTLN